MEDNERGVLTEILLLMDKYDLYKKIATEFETTEMKVAVPSNAIRHRTAVGSIQSFYYRKYRQYPHWQQQ